MLDTPLRAIRKKCKDCTCGNLDEIEKCCIIDCPLWLYRRGKEPLKKEIKIAKE